MAENYRKEKGSEAGLGDLVLEAHDRAVTLGAKRLARMREFDPNIGRDERHGLHPVGIEGRCAPACHRCAAK